MKLKKMNKYHPQLNYLNKPIFNKISTIIVKPTPQVIAISKKVFIITPPLANIEN